MKEQIYKICTQLNDGQITVVEAQEQLLLLFSVVGRSEQLKAFAEHYNTQHYEIIDERFINEYLESL